MLKHYGILAAALLAAPAPAAAGDSADRLARYDDQVVAIMKARLPLAQRVARFDPLVASYYDLPTIAALVVGPGWATTPATDRQAAIAALSHHSAVSLARNFDRYDGQRFTVDPQVQARGSSQVAKLTIQGRDGHANVLLYQLRRGADGAWRIVDVVADGVSQLAVQRADLAATVAAGGAAGLARRLAQADAKAR